MLFRSLLYGIIKETCMSYVQRFTMSSSTHTPGSEKDKLLADDPPLSKDVGAFPTTWAAPLTKAAMSAWQMVHIVMTARFCVYRLL